ncbi:MAG: F0F1 ATP synthase subunit delta [Gammaproteobacteria bacterium]|jgi:F-type H+-transporting ATPase subunit delta
MAQLQTIARPYAKAAFEFALQQNKLDFWYEWLQTAALVASDKRVKKALFNPKIPTDEVLKVFFAVLDNNIDDFGKNFLKLLAKYHRLNILAEVTLFFAKFYAEHKKIAEVQVVSAFALSDEQKTRLATVLEKKLQQQVEINCKVDSNILGGAIVKIGDLVIDGSGRKKLEDLAELLRGRN